jgi:hypothetical protein
VNVKLGLADVYVQQDKVSQALVIVEDVCQKSDAPAKAYVSYARLLVREGDISSAVAQYKLALEIEPESFDEQLSQQLGIGEGYEAGDVFEGRVRESTERLDDTVDTEVERPKIRFEDVGGMEPVKEEIGIKILHPLKHPELYAAYGKQVGGGILMYGPPGCGKTYLARAKSEPDSSRSESATFWKCGPVRASETCRRCLNMHEQTPRAFCFLTKSTRSAEDQRRNETRNGSTVHHGETGRICRGTIRDGNGLPAPARW